MSGLPVHLRGLGRLLEGGDGDAPQTVTYGGGHDQVGDLRLPEGTGPWPVVVLIHGGFWHVPWDRRLMTAIAADLTRRGMATWNIEYARVGLRRGGWPGTFEDVAAAIDRLATLADEHALDLDRVAVLGHSAGGQLAMWAGARPQLDPGVPGASPRVRVAAAVSLAGVLDLEVAAANRVGGSAVAAFLGGEPEAQPERYAVASPVHRLPLGIPQLLVHGDVDEEVPVWLSVEYQTAAERLGDACQLTVVAGEDHMALIDPGSPAWAETAAWLERRSG